MVTHWNAVGKPDGRGVDEATFLQQIKQLPKGQLWRHNQAGDLPHTDGYIDETFLIKLTQANRRKHGFTYTHHLLNEHNQNRIGIANEYGFTVNVSTDTVTQAIDAHQRGFPTVTVLPKDAPNEQICSGVKIVACPAEKSDRVQCSNCALCADAHRNYVIGFRAHGTKAKTVDIIARSN